MDDIFTLLEQTDQRGSIFDEPALASAEQEFKWPNLWRHVLEQDCATSAERILVSLVVFAPELYELERLQVHHPGEEAYIIRFSNPLSLPPL